jgi:hypothetical protein
MLSLGLTFTLFLAWSALGASILFALKVPVGLLRAWLLAPAVGMAVQILSVCILNQMGLPVQSFAWPLAAGLLVLTGVLLVWRRPRVPFRALAPIAAAVVTFVLWAGWPALKLGFNWISFVNDDFTNYCLSAERFRTAGFFTMPTLPQLAGTDYTQYFWFMHILVLMRFGSEQALAFIGSLARMNSIHIFMPVILAFGAAQICSASALVLHRGRWRRQAQWTAALLALSPLFIFGALYQLIAQVGGIALMLATVALLTAAFPTGRRRGLLLRHAVPTAILASALALFYPEITPFAVLTFCAYFVLEWWTAARLPAARIVLLQYTLLGLILALRFNLIAFLYTVAHQAVSGTEAGDLSLTLFPFYLIPAGFATVMGFQSLPETVGEPYGSILIVLGFASFVLAAAWGVRHLRPVRPVACLLAVELAMAAYLFFHGNDFGLYKLAMFIQPALVAGLAGWAVAVGPRRRVTWAIAAAFVALGLRTTWFYTSASTGEKHSGLTEMDHASEYLANVPPAPAAGALWASGVDNIVTVKLAANLYRGSDVRFLVREDFFNVLSFAADSDWPLLNYYPDPGIFHRGIALLHERNRETITFEKLWDSHFNLAKLDRAPDAYLSLPPSLSLFNKLTASQPDAPGFLRVQPARAQENLLVFIHSSRGNHYYLGDRRRISFTQLEQDDFHPSGRISGIGRFFLFQIENPTPRIYLRIAASKTYMAPEHKAWSKQAVAQGAVDVPLHFRGDGAVNRIVGPLTPVWRNGAAYVALDFAEQPAPFPIHRSGLAALYNNWLPMDYRRLVGFARDISALSPAQRDALRRPTRVGDFPGDLANATGLEFSGLYEDGWASPDAEIGLGASTAGQSVRVKGMIPELPGTLPGQTMTASVNGGPEWVFPAVPGRFDWLLPIGRPGVHTDLTLQFSGNAVLPERDQRPVGAKIELIEIVSNSIAGKSADSPRFPSRGIDRDGWAETRAEAWLPASAAATQLTLTIEYPGWPGIRPESELKISADAGAAHVFALKPGTNTISVPVAAGLLVHSLRFESERSFSLPAPDGRVRAFRLVGK